MGYKPKARTFVLEFTDPEFEGLEVVAKSLSTRGLLRLAALAAPLQGMDASKLGQHAGEIEEIFAILGTSLVRWNLEDEDGQPVPATTDAVMDQDLDFVLAIVLPWMSSMAGVAPPLPTPSDSGASSGTSPAMEASLPMG